MSDIEIVPQSAFRYGDTVEGHVPYGTPLDDDSDSANETTYEGLFGVPSVDWSGRSKNSTSTVEPAKRGPGRPRKEAAVEA